MKLQDSLITNISLRNDQCLRFFTDRELPRKYRIATVGWVWPGVDTFNIFNIKWKMFFLFMLSLLQTTFILNYSKLHILGFI